MSHQVSPPARATYVLRRSAETTDHATIQRQFGAYLGDELAEEQRAQVADHLACCGRCAASLVGFLQTLHATTRLLNTLPRHSLPDHLHDRLRMIPSRVATDH